MLVHFVATNTFAVISSKSDAITSIDGEKKSINVDYGKEGLHEGEIIYLDSRKKCDYYCKKFIANQEICFTSDDDNFDELAYSKSKKSKIKGSTLVFFFFSSNKK